MSIEWVRRICMSLPHVTEHIQWEDDLVFKVGGKMIAVLRLNVAPYCMSIKADPEEFAELVEIPGIAPAPYLARAKWIAFESYGVVSRVEMERLLRRSYKLVLEKLPKKTQAELADRTIKAGRKASAKAKPARRRAKP